MTEDEQLLSIDRTLRGDLSAFDALVRHFQDSIIRFTWNLLGDQDAALDIAQETFLAAHKQLPNYDPHRAAFPTWLLAIARNLALKSRRRKRPITLDELPEQIDPTASTQQQAHWKDSFAQLNQALESLPETWQRAFILTEIQSLSYQEASQIEAIPIGTIRSRVARVRAHLRSTLKLEDLL